ncbi:hypothetical protein HYU22_04205 [Candidatus Woesearchaeota archaeon]|nr:hypothetical protein [Candidatus Woesearchaeota archaeon]
MNLIEESFRRLFPGKGFFYQSDLEYNRRLSSFNANIRKSNNKLTLRLNLQWKDIDDEIKIGLIQHLLLKMFKERKNTPNIDLYNNFIKNIPLLTPKTESDPVLENSFQRVNQRFFEHQVEQPNLQWGQRSFRKLASYNFHDDSITMSTLFRQARPEVLDYIMYHEMLHKHFKFKHHNGRSAFHTREFKTAESSYPRQEQIEQEIQQLVRTTRRKNFWKWF